MQEAGVGSKLKVTLLEHVECYRRLTTVDPWGAEDGHYLDGCYVSARRNGDTGFCNLSFA